MGQSNINDWWFNISRKPSIGEQIKLYCTIYRHNLVKTEKQLNNLALLSIIPLKVLKFSKPDIV